MSNVIKLLERMGQDAQLRHADNAVQESAMLNAGIEESVRIALRDKDQQRLHLLLGAQTNVSCILAPVKEDAPAKDEEEITASDRNARRAATVS